jgi:hypothetical protein
MEKQADKKHFQHDRSSQSSCLLNARNAKDPIWQKLAEIAVLSKLFMGSFFLLTLVKNNQIKNF